jgi:hypothetical protein
VNMCIYKKGALMGINLQSLYHLLVSHIQCQAFLCRSHELQTVPLNIFLLFWIATFSAKDFTTYNLTIYN